MLMCCQHFFTWVVRMCTCCGRCLCVCVLPMRMLTWEMSAEGSSKWMAAWIAPDLPGNSPCTGANLPLPNGQKNTQMLHLSAPPTCVTWCNAHILVDPRLHADLLIGRHQEDEILCPVRLVYHTYNISLMVGRDPSSTHKEGKVPSIINLGQ